MRLTPLDIRHKEFGRGMRGYKDLDVDEFLDDIADEFERVFNENIDYKERLEAQEEKIEQYKNIEETLKKTLLSAQQQAEELKHNAKKESDLILRDAELKSRSVLNDCYAERQKVQRSVQALKQKQEDLRYQLRAVLETYMNILDQEGDAGGGVDEALDMAGADMTGTGAAAPGAASDTRETETPAGPERLEIESLPVDEPVIIDEPVTGGDETVGDDFIVETGGDGSVDDYTGQDVSSEVSMREETSAEDEEAEEGPPLSEPAQEEPVAADEEDDDPFADAEIDTEDREFKW